MQHRENEYIVAWEDLDADDAESAATGETQVPDEWQQSPLYVGMQSIHEHLGKLADSLAVTPLDIRVDYEVPQAKPLSGLRQGGYELVEDLPDLRRFWFRFRCAGEQRYDIREASRPARDERIRWLNKRGLSFHVEDDFGSQWHFSLMVRPVVPVSIGFEADTKHDTVRITLNNFEMLDTEYRSIRREAITPALLAELERLILRRSNRFDEFTGNRVENKVRARFRRAIDERRRSRAEELGEDADRTATAAAKVIDSNSAPARNPSGGGTAETRRAAITAPTFVGPRDDEGALEWNADTANGEVAAPARNANAPPTYGWLITAGGTEDTAANLGKHGPPGASRAFPVRRLVTEGHQFRLRDRDGKIAFTGKIAGDFKGPEPITDFGLDHGCLRIEYYRGDKWQELRVKTQD